MALTAAAIKNAKGRTKPYKLTDSDGLFLICDTYWRSLLEDELSPSR